jgi:hypothetical protein
MSDQPTPETDAAWLEQKDTVLLCRKLERERDEAREALTSQKIMIAQHIVITDLMLERDEAREHAQRFRSLYYSHLGINASASWFPWEEKLGHE